MRGAFICLAFGAFAIGTEGYMIAGLLPVLSSDLHVTVATAGLLVTLFAVTYAIATPLLAALCGNVDRRTLLVIALGSFAAANLLAAAAHTFAQLAVARVVLAVAAGLFMPTASAVAASMAAPEKRGRALAIVTGGSTVAVALGVPLGTWIAALGDWRTTFLMIGGVAAVGAIGLARALPRGLTRGAATLSERFAVARVKGMPTALSVTFLWAVGGFAVFTYIAPFLQKTLRLSGTGIGVVLFVIGVSAAAGTALGGQASDRIGADRVVLVFATVLTTILTALTIAAKTAPSLPLIVGLIVIWKIAGWGFGPAQATRLIRLAPANPAIALSLNASAIYLGIAAGSALGSLTIRLVGVEWVGAVGGACQAVGLTVLLVSIRRRVAVEVEERLAA